MSTMDDIRRQLLGIAVASTCVLSADCATAQIRPDSTLPNNSSITINGNIFNITGGTQAGRNLFHSFQEFSLPTNNTAFFNNGSDIQNIFSRVTGGSISTIDGIIKANGTANLFFINPSGIIFGKNASLNVGGSFVATTANAVQFGNLGSFSATVPNNPALLTVNPTALFYNQIAASAGIQNNSISSVNGIVTGLQVPDGKSLLLVGGDINLDGGKLSAYSGQVFLGGLVTSGTVGLSVDGNNFSLNFPTQSARGSVSLSNGGSVNVAGGGGGSINVNASNINITGGSQLSAGIAKGLGNVGAKAGDININATGDVKLDGSGSAITNNVQLQAIGDAGNVNLSSNSLSLTNGAQLQASTSGRGNAGDLTINAANFAHVVSTSPDGQYSSGLSTQAENGSLGNAGNLTINTNELQVTGGAFVSSSTSGSGNAGNLNIKANSVQVIGTSPNDTVSALLAQSQGNATGTPGNLTINTNQLLVQDGAFVSAGISSPRSSSSANVGNLTINASDFVHILGTSPDGNRVSGLSTQAESGTSGRAGNLTINTRELLVQGGAFVSASTKSSANAGKLNINADSVEVSGTSVLRGNGSSVLSEAQPGSSGNAGDLTINTRDLLIQGGAFVSAGTFGAGKAGNLSVTADSVQVIGTSTGGDSGLSTQAENGSTATAQAGRLTINARELLVQDGGFVSSSTKSLGNGGDLNINASSVQVMNNSSLLAQAQFGSSGSAGNLTIKAGQLQVVDHSQISVSNLGSGDAGNLNITAQSTALDNHGKITASSIIGQGGNISFNVQDFLRLQGNSLISNASGGTLSSSNKGNFTLNTNFLIAPFVDNSDIITNAFNGRGGQINITASRGIFGFTVRSQQDLERLLGTTNPNQLDPQRLPTNDIYGIGISQTLQTSTTPDADRSASLASLAQETQIQNSGKLIFSSCRAFNETQGGSNFTMTGRGGLPSSPDEPFTGDAIWTDSRLPASVKVQQQQPKRRVAKIKPKPIEFVPATGWVFDGNGEVTLISSVSNLTSSDTPMSCPAR